MHPGLVSVARYVQEHEYLGPPADMPWDPVDADLNNPDADVPYGFVDPADALDDNDPDDDLVVNLDAVDVDEEM
jgi:hypothetical protein